MFKAVLFDWDGTLADTAEATYRCYERMFREFDIAFDRDVYARTYSPNWYETFRSLGLPEHRWAAADERWLQHFAEESITVMSGAHQLLADLASEGIEIAVVTSGSRDRVTREMEHHGIAPWLRTAVFGTDVVQKKPHPEALWRCLEVLGVKAEEAAYVGDSPEDVRMAKAANVFAVAVPGGYPNLDALRDARPDAFVPTLSDVLNVTMR